MKIKLQAFRQLLISSLKSSFAKNAIILTSGTVLAQAIPILASLFLARIFTEEDIGRHAMFMSIESILLVVIALKYEMGILPAKNKIAAGNTIGLSLSISFAIAVSAVFLISLNPMVIGDLLDFQGVQFLLFLIPLCAIFHIFYQCYNEWSVKNSRFRQLSASKIFHSLFIALVSIGLGLMGFKQYGMILGQMIGMTLTAAYALFMFLKQDFALIRHISFKRMGTVMRRNYKFPFYLLPAQLMNTTFGQVPILFITNYFGVGSAGFFSFAVRMVSVPLTMIAVSIGDIFRQQAQQDKLAIGNSWNKFIKTTIGLSIGGVSIFSCIALLAPFVFQLFFGERWIVSGYYARILCIGEFVNFVAMPTTGLFVVYNKQQLLFIWQVIYSLITFVSVFVGCVIFKDIYTTLFCYTIGRAVVNFIHIGFAGLIAYRGTGCKKPEGT